MIIPVPAIWSRQNPEDPNDRIERVLYNRSHRLMAGLSVDDQFNSVEGALVVTVGNGKYLRLQHAALESARIPDSISATMRAFVEEGSNDLAQLKPLLADLAETQAVVVGEIKKAAGKYVDRVMAVAAVDPGIWTQDFDGHQSYTSFCDAMRLAELSGVTVIDAFPARDIAAGGNGAALDVIPLWLMLADRSAKVASQHRAVWIAQDQSRCYWLPPSDGLDSDVPEIQQVESLGLDFLQRLVARLSQLSIDRPEIERLYANGTSIKSLQDSLQCLLAKSNGESNANLQFQRERKSRNEIVGEMMSLAESFLGNRQESAACLLRTSIEVVVNDLSGHLYKLPGNLAEIFVAAPPQLESCLINRLDHVMPAVKVNSIAMKGFSANGMPAVIAAMLGLLHVDQMPANIPWMTGSQSQRILGRLTPGRPANWRQLVRSMADFRPPAMKLRDAV